MYVGLVITLLVAVVVADEKYTTKFDNVDLDQILKNERLLSSYFNCLMDKGKCTPDGEELKKHLPEALETECAKCSETQRKGAEKVLKFIYEKKPAMFKQLEDKYDANGKYRNKYKKMAQQKNIKV